MGQTKVGDRFVNYDGDASSLGAKHLLTLEAGERESIFNAAKAMPSTGFKFEDRQGRNFTLLRTGSGVYKIVTRGSDSSGWF